MLKRLLLLTSTVLMVLSSPPAHVHAEARHSRANSASALVGVVDVSTERFEHLSGSNQEQ
jgi:hypothetical protein